MKTYSTKVLGGPAALSCLATIKLGQPIQPKDVSKAISILKLSKKKKSTTPGLSVQSERLVFHSQLQVLVWKAEQIVFTDEKYWKITDISKRFGNYGYAPRGQRIPNTARLVSLPKPDFKEVEVIAAIGVTSPKPLADGTSGDIGALSFFFREGRLEKSDKINFYTHMLPVQLSAHPGPHSVVVLDNMPQHREQATEISAAFASSGAYIAWNPPQSPDLNLIEKFWDVVAAKAAHLHLELLSGKHGAFRCLELPDLIECLQNARLSHHSLHGVGLTWL